MFKTGLAFEIIISNNVKDAPLCSVYLNFLKYSANILSQDSAKMRTFLPVATAVNREKTVGNENKIYP